VNRFAVLYLVTLFVLVPLDFLFLGIVAKDFFTSQVGNMLGEIKLAPPILFYLLYVVGFVIFVNGAANVSWQSTLLYGALFGLFATRPSTSPRCRYCGTGAGRSRSSTSPGAPS
jgi:uncharacterized membrane protein